jgi:ribosomal protein S18 acetylase RimI-like enzyme
LNNHQEIPAYPYLDGFTFRPATAGDAQALLDLYTAVNRADRINRASTTREILSDLEDPTLDLQRDTLLAVTPTGSIAGASWDFINQDAVFERRAFIRGDVHPGYRGCGLGCALLGWMEYSASLRLAEFREDLPHYLASSTPDDMPDRTVLFTQHGYDQRRFFYKMYRDLRQPVTEIQTNPLFRFCPWEANMDEPARVMSNIAFLDHWGGDPIDPETWRLHFIDAENFRPELTFVVYAGDLLVGICFNREITENFQDKDVQVGWIDSLAVLKEWRGQGLASALLCASMRAFQQAGLAYAGLTVDTENLTGALRLYERLGFTTIRRHIHWGKAPLSGKN